MWTVKVQYEKFLLNAMFMVNHLFLQLTFNKHYRYTTQSSRHGSALLQAVLVPVDQSSSEVNNNNNNGGDNHIAGQERGPYTCWYRFPNPPSHHPTAEQSHKPFYFSLFEVIVGEEVNRRNGFDLTR